MKIIIILLSIFCSLFLNANLEWKDFDETFNSKVKLPDELKKQLSYLNEKNFYFGSPSLGLIREFWSAI